MSDNCLPLGQDIPPFRRFFLPYGANVHRSVFTPASQSIQIYSASGSQRSARSLSTSSRKTEILRQAQQASIVELFGKDFSFNRTITSPYGQPPLSWRYTPFQFTMALRNRVQGMNPRAVTVWPEMPPLQPPLILPTYELRQLFSTDNDYNDSYKLWSLYGMLGESSTESWICRLLYTGAIVASEVIAKGALCNAFVDYPETFVEYYTYLVEHSSHFLEKFIDDIDNENWDPTCGQQKSIRENVFAKFLLLEAQLNLTDFIHYLFPNLRWDGVWVNRLYLTCSMRLPHPGNTFPLDLQTEARAILRCIGDFGPEDDFDMCIDHLVPSLEFFLGPSNYQMVIRVFHTLGPERLAVAMERKGLSMRTEGEADLAPRHILSFAASFLLIDLYQLAYSVELLGANVTERRTHFLNDETTLFKCCTDSLESLWNIPSARLQIEAKLRQIKASMNTAHILRCNLENVELLKAEGFTCTYWYGKPLPNPRTTPVFTLPPPPPPPPQAVQTVTDNIYELDDTLDYYEEEGGVEGEGDARVYNTEQSPL